MLIRFAEASGTEDKLEEQLASFSFATGYAEELVYFYLLTPIDLASAVKPSSLVKAFSYANQVKYSASLTPQSAVNAQKIITMLEKAGKTPSPEMKLFLQSLVEFPYPMPQGLAQAYAWGG